MEPDLQITSFQDLYELSQAYRKGRWVFRGHSKLSYELVPKVGREGVETKNERRIFEHFVREAAAYMNPLPSSPWAQMAVAQHYGLPTRLLDWTENALVAAYFAAMDSQDEDGAIFMLNTPHVLKSERGSPFDINRVSRYRPSHITGRIAAQRGLFTVHPEPSVAMYPGKIGSTVIDRAVITASFKAKLQWNLSRFGVNRASLFPDLDGLAKHVSWMFSHKDPSEEPYAAEDPHEACT